MRKTSIKYHALTHIFLAVVGGIKMKSRPVHTNDDITNDNYNVLKIILIIWE